MDEMNALKLKLTEMNSSGVNWSAIVIPDKFKEEQALTRDLEQERLVLEGSKPDEAVTADGRKVRLSGWDQEHGYVFGSIDGVAGNHAWGWPNGEHLGCEGFPIGQSKPEWSIQLEVR